MWNYEKTFTISRKNYPDQSEDGPGNHQSVRWTGWRISCVHALFITEVHHAVQRSDRNFNRYWHRGTCHMEMICAIVYQLTKDLSPEEIKASGFDKYYVDHTLALWPQAASGTPWTATYFQSKGDPITDLHEDMAADGATA